jgi:hypothetical protein
MCRGHLPEKLHAEAIKDQQELNAALEKELGTGKGRAIDTADEDPKAATAKAPPETQAADLSCIVIGGLKVLSARMEGDRISFKTAENGGEVEMELGGAAAAGVCELFSQSTVPEVSVALGPAVKAICSAAGLKIGHVAAMSGLACSQRVSCTCKCACLIL